MKALCSQTWTNWALLDEGLPASAHGARCPPRALGPQPAGWGSRSRRQAGSGGGGTAGRGGVEACCLFPAPRTPGSFALEVSQQWCTGGRDSWSSRAGPGLPGGPRSLSDPGGALSTLHLRIQLMAAAGPVAAGCGLPRRTPAVVISGRTVARCEGVPTGTRRGQAPLRPSQPHFSGAWGSTLKTPVAG